MAEEKDKIKSILEKYKIVAVVGLSKDPSKDSYRVAKYLKDAGYRVIPINPFAEEILAEKCYKSLLEMPKEVQKLVEIVDIFRPSQELLQIVDQAIILREDYGVISVIWTQLGIENEESAKRAKKAGLTVITNKCMMIEHSKLIDRNVESLVSALNKMKDKKLRDEMGNKFHEEIMKNWTWTKRIEDFRKMFKMFFEMKK